MLNELTNGEIYFIIFAMTSFGVCGGILFEHFFPSYHSKKDREEHEDYMEWLMEKELT